MAVRLEAKGFPDAMSMTPGRLLFVSRLVDDENRREIDAMAVAGRVAQADQKGWKAFFKDR